MYILNLNTLIYLHEPGDLAKSNLVIHFPKILSRMPLAETNLVIRFPVFLLQMPLAEANIVNTLDFIYIEHNIYCNCIHQKNFKLYKCKKEGKSCTCSACLVTSPNRRSNPGCSSWITRKFLVMIPSSRYYRESILVHYSYFTFYVCSFPHNNKHTYIRHIFKVSISMWKCSYDSILLYS